MRSESWQMVINLSKIEFFVHFIFFFDIQHWFLIYSQYLSQNNLITEEISSIRIDGDVKYSWTVYTSSVENRSRLFSLCSYSWKLIYCFTSRPDPLQYTILEESKYRFRILGNRNNYFAKIFLQAMPVNWKH